MGGRLTLPEGRQLNNVSSEIYWLSMCNVCSRAGLHREHGSKAAGILPPGSGMDDDHCLKATPNAAVLHYTRGLQGPAHITGLE